MALSRLENFLKSSRGKILHVNPENLDSSDSISNDGASPFTPFKTINRALIECARYSYQVGFSNDLFGFCTILLYSGEHYVDNRPGIVIEDDGDGFFRSGSSGIINEFTLNTNFDILDPDNSIYLLNSVYGGVIVPRGTSIIAQDIRKTIVRPLYVPAPENNDIERSAIFRVTGAALFYGFSIKDADPGGFCYKDYTKNKFTPNFSHHKLTGFEYVDGVNPVVINDDFLNISTIRTDLQQYYEKISLVYGASSGRPIDNANYTGELSVDIQPIVDEFRIVGSRGEQIGISQIISGNGVTPTEEITVTLDGLVTGISVDTSIQISGVNISGYDGQFVVSSVPAFNQIKYRTPNIPTVASPPIFGATLNIISDTVQSASPYVFNVSLRSVYGMNGLHADGSKVNGFKSVVIAQFTAVSLQKDNNAFIIYNQESGAYVDSNVVPDLYRSTRARYKPEYENFHVKVSNDAFAQLVSIFSIGYAVQIVAESGGDYSITNSNSNFGAKTFISSGYKKNAFAQDDYGYIVGVIPPEEIPNKISNIEFGQIDLGLSRTASVGAATTTKLYFYEESQLNSPPKVFLDGYKIGAKLNDFLHIKSPSPTSSLIVMPGTENSGQKKFTIQRQNNNSENSITNGVITFTGVHSFNLGEKVRVFSDTGFLPDKISDKIYFVVTSEADNTLFSNQIKLASTFNNAINNIAILPNRTGGTLSVVSEVSDKLPGEPGHPIQWDNNLNNWFITVSETNNGIYDLSTTEVTGKSFVKRISDNRIDENKIYKILYVIPNKTRTNARPPTEGFVIQESNDTSLGGTEFSRYFSEDNLVSDNEIRNPKFISLISWSSNTVTVRTELPHRFNIGSEIEILNVTPSNYNGVYVVSDIIDARTFTYSLSTDPGSFSNDIRVRDGALPYVKRKNTRTIFNIHEVNELQEYIKDVQDGVYELTVINSSNSPSVAPFTDQRFAQPIERLYPALDRDNPNSNPNSSRCFAESNLIGNVVINDTRNSITRETFDKLSSDFNIGIGISAITSDSSGTQHTIYTSSDHGLSALTGVSIVSAGTSYLTGTYFGAGDNTSAAAFKVVVEPTTEISSVEIMYGGSNYSVGQTLTLNSGIGTIPGNVPATIQVTSVNNNLNDSVYIAGFSGNFSDYNNTYRIIAINNSREILVSSASTITGFSETLVPINGSLIFSGKSLAINTFVYNNNTGIAIATFTIQHGLKIGSKIKFSGFNSDFYNNKEVLIVSVNSLTQIEVDFGVSDTSPITTGTNIFGLPVHISSKLNDRRTYYYSEISTTAGSALFSNDPDGTIFIINNAVEIGLKKGDYIEVNGEIMRIRSQVTSNNVNVYRVKFGTDRQTHVVNSVIRKINIIPVELRRNSIIRASGHTFEYVGYGAGNYSTSLPENQDRILSDVEKYRAISTRIAGGVVYYTGMDENGDFYAGNRKISSVTGRQVSFDVPISSLFGKDIFEIISTEKGIFSNSLEVSGDALSKFSGPVLFNEKITIDNDLEIRSLSLEGSNSYGIASTIPVVFGDSGDVKFNEFPTEGGNIGWVFTEENSWKEFGPIQNVDGAYVGIYTGSFFGNFEGEFSVEQIWSNDNVGIHTTKNVGVGTTSANSEYTFFVNGDSNFNGILNVKEIIEDVIVVTDTSLGSQIITDVNIQDNNVYFYSLPSVANWGFNFIYNSSTSLSDYLQVGKTITLALLTTQGSTPFYNQEVFIDGTLITVFEYGDFPITQGNANSIDLYTFVIIKKSNTGNIVNDFTVLRSLSQYKQ